MAEYTGTDNLEIMAEAVNYNRFLLQLIERFARPGDRILDFGAGIGTFAEKVRNSGFQVGCVEVDPAQAAVLKELEFEVAADITELSSDQFDYVYSLNVLEHIKDDIQALKELYRVTKPGGKVLLYLPAMQILFSSMDEKVGHHRRYSRASLQEVAIAAGFTLEACRYADSLGFPATLLYKLLDSESGDISKLPLILYDRLAFPVSRVLDRVFGLVGGKNVYAVLSRPK